MAALVAGSIGVEAASGVAAEDAASGKMPSSPATTAVCKLLALTLRASRPFMRFPVRIAAQVDRKPY
jgi:hypothetical protein